MQYQFTCEKCGEKFQSGMELPTSPFAISIGNISGCPKCGTLVGLPSTEVIADFKFHILESKMLSMKYSDLSVLSPELRCVSDTFVANMHRVVGLAILPRLFSLHIIVNAFNRKDKDTTWMVNELLFPTDTLLERLPNEGTRLAFEGVLYSVLIGTWTAFEVLAADLWIAAVNAHPNPLAMLAGRENRITDCAGRSPQNEDEAIDVTDDTFIVISSNKSIGLNHINKLSQGTFNLSNSMGRLFADANRVKFSSLFEIRSAFSLAFPDNFKGVKSTSIDNALSDRSLDALAITRNMFVHSAGIADADYVDDRKNAPAAVQLNIGQRFELDGDKVSSLVIPVIECSVKLIKAVDTWITNKIRRMTAS